MGSRLPSRGYCSTAEPVEKADALHRANSSGFRVQMSVDGAAPIFCIQRFLRTAVSAGKGDYIWFIEEEFV